MAQNFYHDTVTVEAGPTKFYHDQVYSLTEEIEFTENQIASESQSFIDEVEWFETSLKMTESFKPRLSFENQLFQSETFLPRLSLEDQTVNKKEWMKTFKPSSNNPPYHYETWYIENPVVGESINRVIAPYYPGIIKDVTVYCKDKGTSGTSKVDVKLNGDSIFYQDSDRPKLDYNSSENYGRSDTITQDLIGNGDELTLDILEVASGATGMTVTVTIAQTSIPLNVKKVELVNADGFIYSGTNILPTDSVYFKIYFSTSLVYMPQILIKDNDDNTTAIDVNSLDSDLIDNDTIITNPIDTSEYSGNYKLIVKDALSYTGARQEDFDRTYSFIEGNLEDYLSYDKFVSDPSYEISVDRIDLYENSISKYSYSLDNSNWTEDADITNPFTINITNSDVGGDSSEGSKTIYLRFKNDTGAYISTSITTGYYTTAIDINAIGRKSSNNYIVGYTTPTDVATVPPKSIKVYNDNTEIFSQNIHNLVLEGLEGSISYNETTEQFDIAVTSGYISDREGVSPVSVDATTLNIDKVTIENTYESQRKYELHLILIPKGGGDITSVLAKTKMPVNDTNELGVEQSDRITSEEIQESVKTYSSDYVVLYILVLEAQLDPDAAVLKDFRFNYKRIFLHIEEEDIDLSLVYTDQAERSVTKSVKVTKNDIPMRIRLFEGIEDSFGDYIVSGEIQSGTVVNELEDTYYVKGYKEEDYW